VTGSSRVVHSIAVALLTEDNQHRAALEHKIEATHVARIVFSPIGFPLGTTDPVLRQIQDHQTEIVIVNLSSESPEYAIHAIELIRATTSEIAIFAIGEMRNPVHIVSAMRAGAGEFVDRAGGSDALLEAFNRFSVNRAKGRASASKARIFAVLNAKGGAGATTLAVNLATALQQKHGQTILVDFAPIGHAALHLDVKPSFGVLDALQNLDRMDAALLEGLITTTRDGLHLLAGPPQPYASGATAVELARLFDLLVGRYRYVVVDCSGRLDTTTRLLADLANAVLMIAQTDVVSLWSAGRIRNFLEDGANRNRLRLVLNRYKKIPGFTEEDVEKATNCKILWKLPNNYQLIAPAIDKGVPVAGHDGQELSRSFRALADLLAEAAHAEDGVDLIYQHDRADAKKKKSPGRLLISPLRAGQ
jgi:pilus assembly protein CpaE